MPVYEYECESCSCQFELKQSFTDESVAICPKCKKRARRVFVPVPVIFKGTGFYVTDHKSENSTLGKKPDIEKPVPAASKEKAPKKEPKKAE